MSTAELTLEVNTVKSVLVALSNQLEKAVEKAMTVAKANQEYLRHIHGMVKKLTEKFEKSHLGRAFELHRLKLQRSYRLYVYEWIRHQVVWRRYIVEKSQTDLPEVLSLILKEPRDFLNIINALMLLETRYRAFRKNIDRKWTFIPEVGVSKSSEKYPHPPKRSRILKNCVQLYIHVKIDSDSLQMSVRNRFFSLSTELQGHEFTLRPRILLSCVTWYDDFLSTFFCMYCWPSTCSTQIAETPFGHHTSTRHRDESFIPRPLIMCKYLSQRRDFEFILLLQVIQPTDERIVCTIALFWPSLCGISSHLWHAFLWHKSHILAPRRSHHTRIRSCASLTPRCQNQIAEPRIFIITKTWLLFMYIKNYLITFYIAVHASPLFASVLSRCPIRCAEMCVIWSPPVWAGFGSLFSLPRCRADRTNRKPSQASHHCSVRCPHVLQPLGPVQSSGYVTESGYSSTRSYFESLFVIYRQLKLLLFCY
ncbi:unnamed protein product [Trichogramma brassicae]|uniref:Uncharacterized protein n=1 Tax=Trichogramma brassicae TaxID=86971 RepID=A0A6H5IQW5_9HYME|nr:unnamed protein product [Trichogramma brassicae]